MHELLDLRVTVLKQALGRYPWGLPPSLDPRSCLA